MDNKSPDGFILSYFIMTSKSIIPCNNDNISFASNIAIEVMEWIFSS